MTLNTPEGARVISVVTHPIDVSTMRERDALARLYRHRERAALDYDMSFWFIQLCDQKIAELLDRMAEGESRSSAGGEGAGERPPWFRRGLSRHHPDKR